MVNAKLPDFVVNSFAGTFFSFHHILNYGLTLSFNRSFGACFCLWLGPPWLNLRLILPVTICGS